MSVMVKKDPQTENKNIKHKLKDENKNVKNQKSTLNLLMKCSSVYDNTKY